MIGRRDKVTCDPTCKLSLTGCYKCGDGIKNGSEQCDGGDPTWMTCGALGFEAGSLTCTSGCTFDTSQCYSFPPLGITPSSPTVAPRGSVTFSASGGNWTGYAFSLAVNNSGGSITTGGSYVAGPTGSVTDTVKLVDSWGHSATATVSVGPGVTITPSTVTTGWPGGVYFSASSGSGSGYAFSLSVNSSGGIISSSGSYVAGLEGNVTDTVQVVDSLGNTATAGVSVLQPLYSSPVTAMVAPGGQQQLTPGGGSGSYSWSMGASASQGTVSSSGLYTAGTGGLGTDVVKLTDSVTGATLDIAVVVASTFINQSFANTTPAGPPV